VFFKAVFCKNDQLQKRKPCNWLTDNKLDERTFAQQFLVRCFELNRLIINWLFSYTPRFMH
jgi:hypothetical protein